MRDDTGALRQAVLAASCRSLELAARSERNLARAHAACLASRPSSRFAWLEGEVDGCALVALVRRDATVVVDRRLRRRVALLQAMGDRLANGAAVRVGVDPLSSLLTLIRACDRLHSVTVMREGAGPGVSATPGVPATPEGPAGTAGAGARPS